MTVIVGSGHATTRPRGRRPRLNRCASAPRTLVLRVLALTTLVLIAGRVPIARAAYVLEYLGTAASELGGRTMPVSLTIDAHTQELCVADSRDGAIYLLGNGDVETFRTNPLAGVASPWDGCIDLLGRIVFAERGISPLAVLKRLNVFGEPESFTPQVPDSVWNPQRVIVTRDGNYVSLDPMSGLLAKHDAATGELLWTHRCHVDGVTGENLGRPAEAPDGRIYVPGADLRVVLVLSADGAPAGVFGRFGASVGRFVLPVGVAFGPSGEVLVLDRLRAKILVFDPQHEFVTEFGSLGFGPGQFYHPAALAATASGKVYVAQGFQGRVQVFRLGRSEGA